MNRFPTILTVATCISALGLFTTGAVAQQRAGGNGRALDANPRVGSGGTNSPEGQVDYSVRNDMVTGDVAGGRGLRIDQPYRAANEFGGELGSDDLFDFRAQSLPSAPTRLNAVQPPVNLGGTPSVYRSYSSAPTILSDQYGTSRRVGVGAAFPADRLAGPDLFIRGGLGEGPGLDTYDNLAPGRALEIIRTPLPTAAPPVLRSLTPGVAPAAPAPGPGAAPTEQGEIAPDARRDTRLELPQYRPLLGETQPQDDKDLRGAPRRDDAPGATMLLGRQLQGRLGSERADRVDPMVQQRMDRLSESLLNPAAQPGGVDANSPYANLMRAVRGEEPGNDADQRPDPPTAAPGQDDTPPVEQERTTRQARIDLGTMDESKTEQAERQRTQALRRAYGSAEDADPEADTARESRAGDSPYPDPLSGLLDRLNYDLPALGSLTGDQQTRMNRLMREAEIALGAGQYFDAERLYRHVVQQQPDDPMAKVGLIHAQLGAGMIRSAALNLRSLFEHHPEMIAARYQANLLPAEDRLRWVRSELEEALQAGKSGAEPALLLAYLGYQVDSRQLVRYGLATAEARAPRDPLMPVLRHIWLDQTDNSSNSPQ